MFFFSFHKQLKSLVPINPDRCKMRQRHNTLQDKDTVHYKTKTQYTTRQRHNTLQDKDSTRHTRDVPGAIIKSIAQGANIQYTTQEKEPGGIFSGFLSSVTDEQMPHGSSISAHFPALQNLPRSHRKYLHTPSHPTPPQSPTRFPSSCSWFGHCPCHPSSPSPSSSHLSSPSPPSTSLSR